MPNRRCICQNADPRSPIPPGGDGCERDSRGFQPGVESHLEEIRGGLMAPQGHSLSKLEVLLSLPASSFVQAGSTAASEEDADVVLTPELTSESPTRHEAGRLNERQNYFNGYL